MFCHKCGAQIADNAAFCKKCGAKMLADNDERSVAAQQSPQPIQTQTQDAPKKKKLGKLPIILGAALLVIVLIMIVASMGSSSQQTQSSSNTGGVNLSKTYTNEAEGISFKYPSAWEPIGTREIKNYYTEVESENIVVFLANETQDAPELNAYIEVLKFPSSQADIDRLWLTDEEFMASFDGDVSITKTSVIQLDGVSARMIVFATAEDIIYRSYFYGVDSNLYRVNFIRKGEISANLERFFDAIIDSYTIVADDKSGGKDAKSPSSDEILYKGQPVVPLLGVKSEELYNIFGSPTGGTPVTGELLFGATEFYTYDGISFMLDDQGTIININVSADALELNGATLSQNRTGIISMLGTPGYEEKLPEDESGEGFGGYYIMEYTSYEDLTIITVQMPNADSNANTITIGWYDDGPSEEEYQASDNAIDDSFEWVEPASGNTNNSTGITHVKGVIKNTSTQTYSYVQISFNLYDSSGNQVGTASATINDLKAGGTWSFNAVSFSSNVSRFEFSSIDAF